MNRNYVKNNKPSYKAYIFWSIIALLTLIFIGFVIVKFIEARNVQTMNDITNLREQQIFEQEGNYYVYVYSKVGVTEDKYDLEKANELEETITTYLTYVKRNKDANKLYGMIVDNYGNISVLIDGSTNTSTKNVTSFDKLKINRGDIPILLKISGGKITDQFLEETKIREELQTAMGIN